MSLDYAYNQYYKVEAEYKSYIDAREKRESQRHEPFRIVFCGVFSSGKSTLINALLGGEYLPTGINPVTKVVTRIRYGLSLKYYCVNGNKTKLIREDTMQKIVQGKETLPKGYTELLLQVPSQLLQNDVELVDTPGYQDNSTLEAISRAAVINADMAVMCFNGAIFGKMFEKEYLEELNRSVGNFCMVVNRMDCLNTDEDYQLIEEYAKKLMYNRGNAASPNYKKGKCFLTVSCGRYKNLNGFAEYIGSVLSSRQQMGRIRRTTSERYISFLREQLRRDLDNAYESIQNEHQKLLEKSEAEKRKADTHYSLQKQSLENRIQTALSKANSTANSTVHSLKTKFTQIKNNDGPNLFVEKASSETKEKINALIYTISLYAQQQGFGNQFYIRNRIQPSVLDTYKVPAPKSHIERRKSYGMIGRTIVTLINFAALDFEIDDGCTDVTVYNDYVADAVTSVRNRLINVVKSEYKKYLKQEWLETEVKTLSTTDNNNYQNDLNSLHEILYKLSDISDAL